MTRVMNESPETLSKSAFGGDEASVFPPIGSPEHSALVDAIRLNFPEIYAAADDVKIGTHFGEPVATISPVRASQSA